MKLSIKELKEIRNNLPVNSELFKKINKEIAVKKAEKEIKKAQEKIKLANETLKTVRECFDFDKEDTLEDLFKEISAITEVETNNGGCFALPQVILTIKVNALKNGELERIVKFKNNNKRVYVQIKWQCTLTNE